MQKFIGPMGIAFGPQHATHHHLCFWKTQAEHVHQRYRSTLADVAAGGAKVRLGCAIECQLQPRRCVWCVPARGPRSFFKSHPRLVGRVVFKQGLELCNRRSGFYEGRQTQRKFECGVGAQHIAGIAQFGHSFDTCHA